MKNENVIQKQILNLHMHKPVSSPFTFQEEVSKWCNKVLVNAIEKVLEKYTSVEEIITIDKLELSLDADGILDEAIAEKIALCLQKEIQSRIYSGSVVKHSKATTALEVFIFFLQNGYLPWWSNVMQIDFDAFDKLVNRDAQKKLSELFKNRSIAARVAASLSQENFIKIMVRVFDANENEVESLFQKIEGLASIVQDQNQRNQFLVLIKQQVIMALRHGKQEAEVMKYAIDLLVEKYGLNEQELKQQIQRSEILSNDIVLHKLILSTSTKEQSKRKDLLSNDNISSDIDNQKIVRLQKESLSQKHDGIYISNAGLVLLAPFIPRLFENLGIVANDSFNSKDIALAMLQWLSTGKDLHAEFDLVLPKIICGMEPGEPVMIIPVLPEGFQKEGESLLQSVIDNWSILKNTSITGLQESFLQREGKLSFQNNEWLLQVEQKPYDMLLEHLPWNISMIRLSWMPWLLRTEWV